MKIKMLRWRDFCFLGIFALFNISTVGNIKYLLALLFAAFYFLVQYQYGTPLTMRGAGRSFFVILGGLCGLFLITAVLQMFNGFQSYAINEVIYFITPLFFVWVYVSMTSRERLGKMLDYMFYILIAAFIYLKWPYLSFSYLKYVSFANSFSVFESGYGYTSVVLECVFLMRGEKKKAFAAMVLSLLCFKRFNMVAAVLIFIFAKWIIAEKPASKKVMNIVVLGYILLPVITCIVLDEDFLMWFEQQFGVSLAQLTLTRSDRIIAVVNSDEIKYGLGSTTVFMTKYFQAIHNSEVEQWNLHNDLVRIYVECGILGTIIFTCTCFKATATSQTAFIIMCYVFAECFVNHKLGAGSVGLWIAIYTAFAYLMASDRKTVEKGILGKPDEDSICKNHTQ